MQNNVDHIQYCKRKAIGTKLMYNATEMHKHLDHIKYIHQTKIQCYKNVDIAFITVNTIHLSIDNGQYQNIRHNSINTFI